MEDRSKQRPQLKGISSPNSGAQDIDSIELAEDEDERPGFPWIPAVLIALLLAVLTCWVVSNQAPEKAKNIPPMPVSITTVMAQPMPVQIRTIGNVTPVSSVSIKSRIQGHITNVHFKKRK